MLLGLSVAASGLSTELRDEWYRSAETKLGSMLRDNGSPSQAGSAQLNFGSAAGMAIPGPEASDQGAVVLQTGNSPLKGHISVMSYMTQAGKKWVRVNQSAIAAESHLYNLANTDKDPGPPYDPYVDPHAAEWISFPTLILKGERHTGTNLLQEIVTTNLNYTNQVLDLDATYRFCFAPDAVRHGLNCCWKHGFADDRCTPSYKTAKPAYLFLVRSVYPWLLAMHREPYEYNGPRHPEAYAQSQQNFSAFLRAPANYERVWLAEDPSNAYRLTSKYDGTYLVEPYTHDNPVAMWRDKMRSYLNVSAPRVIVTHDDMYDQQKLSTKLNGLSNGGFHFIPGKYNETSGLFAYPPMDDSDSLGDKYTRLFTLKKFEQSKADSDANKRWLSSFTQADFDFVNSQLDEELMQQLGLDMVRSETESAGGNDDT